MYGYIYRTNNLINGKMYIGKKVSTKFLAEKYLGSGKLLKRAVNKYGKENFKVELLAEAKNKDELIALEKEWIKFFKADSCSDYYNIASGGEGGAGPRSSTTKTKISEWNKNTVTIHKNTNILKIQVNQLDTYLLEGWVKGLPENYFSRSDSWKQNVRKTTLGKKLMIKDNKRIWVRKEDIKKRLAEGWEFYKGYSCKYKPKRVEGEGSYKYMTKNNIFKLIPQSKWDEFLNDGWEFKGPSHGKGRQAPNKGKKASTETKKKLSEAHKRKIYVHKELEIKYILKEEACKLISLGWLPGKNRIAYRNYVWNLKRAYKNLVEGNPKENIPSMSYLDAFNAIANERTEMTREYLYEMLKPSMKNVTYEEVFPN